MVGINTAISTIRNERDIALPPPRRNDVFISYSRKDIEFVRTLDNAFRQIDRDPWVDWDDIKKGENWWQAIEAGIEGADTFLFVISPDSVTSTVCRQEIDHAIKHNKRIMPLLYREGFDMQQMHSALSCHNWLCFRETDNFEHAFRDLIVALETDFDHVRAHTRLLVRAIEWESKDYDDSFLLRGNDLRDAEKWLIEGIQQKPKPTKLQCDFISVSRQVEQVKLKAQDQAKRVVAITAVMANAVIAIAGYFVVNFATYKAVELIREEMIDTISGAISGINGNEFEELAKLPSSTSIEALNDNSLYQNHQRWLDIVHQVEPRAYPYTFIRGAQPNEVLWIGDIYRETRPAAATTFRESYTANPAKTALYQGFDGITITTKPYTDQWGTWVSIYAPIRNSDQEVVGGVGIDFRASYVTEVEITIRRALVGAYLITFICLVILGFVIFRVTYSLTKPPISAKQLMTAKSVR